MKATSKTATKAAKAVKRSKEEATEREALLTIVAYDSKRCHVASPFRGATVCGVRLNEGSMSAWSIKERSELEGVEFCNDCKVNVHAA